MEGVHVDAHNSIWSHGKKDDKGKSKNFRSEGQSKRKVKGKTKAKNGKSNGKGRQER
jgi:hypothetical protein